MSPRGPALQPAGQSISIELPPPAAGLPSSSLHLPLRCPPRRGRVLSPSARGARRSRTTPSDRVRLCDHGSPHVAARSKPSRPKGSSATINFEPVADLLARCRVLARAAASRRSTCRAWPRQRALARSDPPGNRLSVGAVAVGEVEKRAVQRLCRGVAQPHDDSRRRPPRHWSTDVSAAAHRRRPARAVAPSRVDFLAVLSGRDLHLYRAGRPGRGVCQLCSRCVRRRDVFQAPRRRSRRYAR